MTELKTLKDIEQDSIMRNGRKHKIIRPHILKKEAIKWVKHIGEQCKNRSCAMCRGKEQVMTQFFNITEDDLK